MIATAYKNTIAYYYIRETEMLRATGRKDFSPQFLRKDLILKVLQKFK